MFSKPEHGWCQFSIDDFSFWFSYLNDTPQDFINQFVNALNTRSLFCVSMEGEPTQCILVIDEYWILHIIIDECATIKEEKEQEEDFTLRSFEIDMVEFVQEFIDDMERYEEEFAYWQVLADWDQPKKYDLLELKESLNKHKKYRGIK